MGQLPVREGLEEGVERPGVDAVAVEGRQFLVDQQLGGPAEARFEQPDKPPRPGIVFGGRLEGGEIEFAHQGFQINLGIGGHRRLSER